jgi:CDP-glucose 4,6-dehydratase
MTKTPDATFWRDRRVLVTGHTGFKGAWLTLWLKALGAQVTGIALPPPPGPSLWSSLDEPCRSIMLDIRDRPALAAAVKAADPEIILHLAAQALVQESYLDPAGTFETNVLGTINLLEGARACENLRAIVNVTSDKAYENVEQVWGYRETDPMGGSDPYSASKGCADLAATAWRRSYFSGPQGPFLASARAGNVIGGGDWAANRLVPDAVRAFSAGAPLRVRNPLATRPWQHVLEPLGGYLILAETLWSQGQAAAEGWNFGPMDEDPWTVARVCDALVEAWGVGAVWGLDEASHPHEAHALRVDAAKARQRLGWTPRLTTRQALDWTVEWYKQADSTGPAAAALAQIEHYGRLA